MFCHIQEILSDGYEYTFAEIILLILIIASASADASADESAAKYSEMSAILGVLSNI